MPTTVINNLSDLQKFAGDFAKTLKGGEIVGLVGDLGAGKTTFVQFLAAAFGVKKPVRSPTFILMQVLETQKGEEAEVRRLCHIDAYRLKDATELFAIGFEEYAGRPETVTLVEWSDRVPAIRQLPGYREVAFSFGKGEGEGRIITT